ncbi:D-hexose-6-phosphate mutarotase [Diaminobutyricimonas sp. LJ205]|uniref:D-hexose-6-phosphate mutarotase n=1 Tax=Diaminobutyricimonas sp. LJ205 TaxID=2683590 RepID=UPI0012F4C494|nr:D-hexose-6-phosphate mutarotase [Diaminobutyricimonas sp. LJ205]
MTLTRDSGAGGLDRVRIDHSAANAELYLHGGQLTSWAPAGNGEALWLSEHSRFRAGSAIRGGVPICFPWFGPHGTDASAPAHGFARTTDWEFFGADESDDAVTVTLRLTDTDETRASAWPHRFEAFYTVRVGEQLDLSLTVANRDDVAFRYEQALHTYLTVGDVRDIRIRGLEDIPYLDKVLGGPSLPGQAGPLTITGETDRIYLGPAEPTVVEDPALGRSITVTKSGSETTVVWNPWVDKAHGMSDFGDDEWQGMLCVEASNVGALAISLPPGESHTMSVRFELASL